MTGVVANLLTKGAGSVASSAKTAGNEEAARLLMSPYLTPELRLAMEKAARGMRPSLIAPAAPAIGVTTEKRKPIEIVVRGGSPALAGGY
jgi:hypothetical protein